jgi:acyl carrier protein
VPYSVTEEAVFELIKGELVDIGVEAPVERDTQFNDLEIDSLDAADLLARIKKDYGVEIHRSKLVDITVGDLAREVTAARATL